METLRIERYGQVYVLLLNRPDKLNTINLLMLEELSKALQELSSLDELRVLVIRGNGRAFCAGADVSEFIKLTPSTALNFSRKGKEVLKYLAHFPRPTLAAINGYALGGGLELALNCDLRFASSAALLGLPEINLGIFPGFGGTVKLPKIIGKAKALEMMYTGDRISAEEALRVGLVNRVIPSEKFDEEVMTFANRLALKSPAILKLLKTAVISSLDSPEEVGSPIESLAWALTFTTDDQKEGIKAFLEKREPKFSGK
ncbi:crotonase [Sulfodiicoccus acidiphilus]|uniref:Crotonase n=1 Tax=Sulfodiicoccus acidiphilus TaxID=1670455 RepID=A0A348B0K2_9CREN|nr:enoyl-CoA hydratase-related protein [Sulfodiicoccus acidiphilus]BBD71704.1 crotonase [Sulfodiicoccus acidiphilus]GGT86480.1 crotonase [Sulfodiicoccus acidiphilus]